MAPTKSRITIYDNSGMWLAELDAQTFRSWKLNDYGSGSFTLSTKDAKCTEQFLQFGNFVYITSDKLPVWGGMIDTPRSWGVGTITSSIYSIEYALKSEHMPNLVQLVTGTPGAIFQKLMTRPLGNNTVPIVVGDIFGKGVSDKKEYNLSNVYDSIASLSNDSGNDWDLLPAIDSNGSLYFIANWYQRKGIDSNFMLYEDHNIKLSDRLLVEQGKIITYVRAYGEGGAWSSKPTVFEYDEENIAKYGHRSDTLSVKSTGTLMLREAARTYLDENKEPRRTFDLVVLNVGDTYNHVRLGNTHKAEFYNVGFSADGIGISTKVRILQMSFDDLNNQMKLVVDEVV